MIPCDEIAIPPSGRRAIEAQKRRIRWSKRVGPGPSPLVPKTNNKNASCRIDFFVAVAAVVAVVADVSIAATENIIALVYCVETKWNAIFLYLLQSRYYLSSLF